MKKIIFTHLFSILLLITLFSSSSMAQPNASYKIYETATGDEIAWATLVEKVASANIILWGEEHDDSIGHSLELKMLVGLNSMKKKPLAFSMEMFETDVQGVMDEYLAGWISEKNFKKDARVWGNYTNYSAMVNFAKENKIPVICANAPSRYTNMVTRGNYAALSVLPKATKLAYLPPFPLDTLKGAYSEKFLEIMGGHADPNRHLYASQNLWDASMANRILINSRKHQVFHINGRFHTDEYLGTAARVMAKAKGDVKTISCFKGENYNPATDKKLADYVIVTTISAVPK